MLEVSKYDELKRALLHNGDEIHVINKKLSKEILERLKKYRYIYYAMLVNDPEPCCKYF
jgi:hypothetical protein